MSTEKIQWEGRGTIARGRKRRISRKREERDFRARRDDQHQLGDMSRTRIKNRGRRSGNLEGTALGKAGEERRCVSGGKGRRKGGRGAALRAKDIEKKRGQGTETEYEL